MRQLVKEHRNEQEERGDKSAHPVRTRRDVRQDLREVPGGETLGDQAIDDKPTGVDADRNAKDPKQRQGTAHRRPSWES
jgi:hypothetical protein